MQIIPAIQKTVKHLYVFQRTPGWVLPRLQRNIGSLEQSLYQNFPFLLKTKRELQFWFYELIGTTSPFKSNFIQKTLTKIGLYMLNRSIMDSTLKEKLRPNYKIGCKRILVSDEFYKALNNPNVNLLTDSIVAINSNSIETTKNKYDVDVIIYATGFNVADIEQYISIQGLNKVLLHDIWEKNGAEAFLGTHIAQFPNLSYLLGPNSELSHSSVLHAMEPQVHYIIEYLKYASTKPAYSYINVKQDVQIQYNQKIHNKLKDMVWNSGCNSWFLNKNNKNIVIFPGSLSAFRKCTQHFDQNNYELIFPKVLES